MGALSEAVHDEVDGLLLPQGDSQAWAVALQRLIDHPGMIDRWRSQIRPPLPFAEHAKQVAALYGTVMAGRLPTQHGNQP
jgi:glycosyltransferase involved in cell wall biosynthesis